MSRRPVGASQPPELHLTRPIWRPTRLVARRVAHGLEAVEHQVQSDQVFVAVEVLKSDRPTVNPRSDAQTERGKLYSIFARMRKAPLESDADLG